MDRNTFIITIIILLASSFLGRIRHCAIKRMEAWGAQFGTLTMALYGSVSPA